MLGIKLALGVMFVAVIVEAGGVKLPPYIVPCNRNAIDLNECATRNGQAAVPILVQGDKSFKVPNMQPLLIPQIEFDASKTLKISVKDAEIHGLEGAQIRDIKMDLHNQHFKFIVHLPRVNLLGQYDINGRILILPIQGKGPCNITLIGGTFNYDIYYDLVSRKGDQYINIKKSQVDYDSKRTYFYLENLFNGDKRLGDEMNNFINENWREVSHDIGPALTETISQIITQILGNILKKVPYDIIFPV